MWLIMVIPSLIISAFLVLGFQREYITHESMTYTNQMLGGNSTNPINYEQLDIDKAIMNLGTLTNHGSIWGAMNITTLGEKYYNDITKDPSLENIMKTVAEFTSEDLENDPELKEIQSLVQSVIKEDLKINNPLDMMMMGLKVMAAKGGSQDKEMEEMASKIQRRIEIYYKNKMKPVLRALAKEQG